MYPAGELAHIAARKALLQARIAVRRHQCVVAGRELAKPVELIDRGLQLWRKIAPLVTLAGLPLAFMAIRRRTKRTSKSKLSRVFAMLPLVLRGLRLARQMRASRNAASAARTPAF
jgi:hypothetical protein